MRIALLFLVLTILASGCEPLSVKGVVVGEDLKPISGASVQVKRSPEAGFTVVTDSAGAFLLSPLRLEDSILVDLPGYAPFRDVYQPYLRRGHLYTIMLEKVPALPTNSRKTVLHYDR